MSGAARSSDDDDEVPHPRETTVWFGHAEVEAALLDNYRSGRVAHAWLIGGPEGIGKATLAYRMARFVLAHPDPLADPVQKAQSLSIDPEHPIARRIAARTHGDLLVLERSLNDSGTLRSVITVDEVRRTTGFLGSTAGEGGWRVCIIDSADELQYPQASNALLKVLEEPPPRTLFLLVSHAPGRLLPTIRSRCRRVSMRSLASSVVAQAVGSALERDPSEDEIQRAAKAADGSVGRAIVMLGGASLAVRERVIDMLAGLPSLDPKALHALGDTLVRADDRTFSTFVDTIRDWLSGRLSNALADGGERGVPGRLAQVAEVWEKLNGAARDVEVFNLDRKPMVFSVFGLLAEAVRR